MQSNEQKIRLAKFLSDSGVASRRQAERLISDGQISVNGQVVVSLGTKVDPRQDQVYFMGRAIKSADKVYYLLNKPTGYICSVRDPHNKKTVLSLVPAKPKVWPVGRLDMDSSGLLLLTNDGDLTFQFTHPKFAVRKTYWVKVNKTINKKDLTALRQGTKLTEGLAKADKVVEQGQRELLISIHQGWKRQIRRMLASLGYRVVSLVRISEGDLTLGDLPPGKYKELKRSDIIN